MIMHSFNFSPPLSTPLFVLVLLFCFDLFILKGKILKSIPQKPIWIFKLESVVKWATRYFLILIFIGFLQASESSFLDHGIGYHVSKDKSVSIKKGAFIQEVSFTPSIVSIDNVDLEIDQIWLEYSLDYFFVVEVIPFIYEIPIWKKTGSYNIVYRFRGSDDFEQFRERYSFIIKSKGLKSSRRIGITNGRIEGHLVTDNLNWDEIELAIIDIEDGWKLIHSGITISKESV